MDAGAPASVRYRIVIKNNCETKTMKTTPAEVGSSESPWSARDDEETPDGSGKTANGGEAECVRGSGRPQASDLSTQCVVCNESNTCKFVKLQTL